MTLEKKISKAFGLHGDEWLRHANPWSVWTRFIILPLMVVGIWSRVWLGWYSLLPIGLLIVWALINPRVFPRPTTTRSWASRCVIGERIWANRDEIAVPQHHKGMILILTLIQGLGSLLLAYGLYALAFWPTLCGVVVVYMGKMWFLDRMVWLCEEMKQEPAYSHLLY